MSAKHFFLLFLLPIVQADPAFGQSARQTPYFVSNAQPAPSSMPWDFYGASVVFLGDVNGNGSDDYAVGAPDVYFPPSPAGRIEVRDGRSAALIWARTANQQPTRFGSAMARVPDIDGDGVDDLAASSRLLVQPPATVPAIMEILWFSGASGVVLGQQSVAYQRIAPARLISIRDANGDAEEEIAFVEDQGLQVASRLRIVSRQAGELSSQPLATRSSGHGFGLVGLTRSLNDDVDLTGDGIPELVIGQPQGWIPGASGSPSGTVEALDGATLQPLWAVQGLMPSGRFGAALVPYPDVSGDGIPEIVVGEPGDGASATRGLVYLLNGQTGSLETILAPPISLDVRHFGMSLTRSVFAFSWFPSVPPGPPLPPPTLFIGCRAGSASSNVPNVVALAGAFGQNGSASAGPRRLETPLAPGIDTTFPIAAGGDLNGDGTADLVIGVPDSAQAGYVLPFRSRDWGVDPEDAGGSASLYMVSYGTYAGGVVSAWGGTPGAACTLVMGLVPAQIPVLDANLLIDVSTPGAAVLKAGGFDAAAAAYFDVSPELGGLSGSGLSVLMQAFELLPTNPPTLAVSPRHQVTL